MKDSEINKSTAQLKEICFEMNLLLVEDDTVLQSQLKQLLGRFFSRVDVADNGLEGMNRYSERLYDLIVTDLTMPIMDGISFCKNVREINEQQNILVLSAHSDSEKLLELVNIGIDGFMLKPVNMEIVLNQLCKTTQAIYNKKMLSYYSSMLEETNEELRYSNKELDSTLNELTRFKTSNKELETTSQTDDMISAVDFHNTYSIEFDKTNEDLEYLEDTFNSMLIKLEKTHKSEIIRQLAQLLNDYASVVNNFQEFENLYNSLKKLEKAFISAKDLDMQNIMPKMIYLFDTLEEWRKGIFFYESAQDIYAMDKLLQNAFNQINLGINEK